MGVFLKPHGIPCSIGVASLGQCLRRRCGCYLLFLVYKYIKKEIYVHDKWGYYGEIGLKWVIMASSLADGKHGLIYVFGRYMYLIHTCACACVNRFSIKWFSKLWKSSRVIFFTALWSYAPLSFNIFRLERYYAWFGRFWRHVIMHVWLLM